MTKIKATHVLLDTSKLTPQMYRNLISKGGIPIIDESMASATPPPPWNEVFAQWGASITNRMTEKAARNYMYFVKRFLGDLSQPVAMPTEAMLERFVNASGITAGSRHGRRTSLNSFFTYLANDGKLTYNPVKNIRPKWRDLPHSLAVPNPDPPFTQEEFDKMMANQKVFHGFWRWGVALGWCLGLRMVDVVRVPFGAWGEDTFNFRNSKTGSVISLPYDHPQLGAGFMRQIRAEVFAHPLLDREPDTLCWPKITAQYNRDSCKLGDKFKKLTKSVGITGKNFHSLRRGCATRCHQAGVSLELIGTFLGHASINQTTAYIHAPINMSDLHGPKQTT